MRIALLVLTAGTLALACGNDAKDSHFSYEAVPVYEANDGHRFYVDERCRPFVSDQVVATVVERNASVAERVLADADFEIIDRIGTDTGSVTWLVSVPEGAVPDAIAHLQGFDAFEGAQGNPIGKIPEATTNLPCIPGGAQP